MQHHLKHCNRKRNLNIDNFHSLFPNCDRPSWADIFSPKWFRLNMLILIATNRFLHIPNSTMWECVLSLDLLHRVYGEPVQQSTGKWFITSCLIILNSKWKRKWTRRFLVRISLKTTKVEKKVLPTISITLSTRNRVYILCGSRTLRDIQPVHLFLKRYKTILTFPFLSLFLLKMGISNKNQNTKEEISTIRHSLKRRK